MDPVPPHCIHHNGVHELAARQYRDNPKRRHRKAEAGRRHTVATTNMPMHRLHHEVSPSTAAASRAARTARRPRGHRPRGHRPPLHYFADAAATPQLARRTPAKASSPCPAPNFTTDGRQPTLHHERAACPPHPTRKIAGAGAAQRAYSEGPAAHTARTAESYTPTPRHHSCIHRTPESPQSERGESMPKFSPPEELGPMPFSL